MINAAAAYLEATKIEPSSPLGFLRLGIIYAKQKDESRATAAFDDAERFYARSGDAYGEVEVLHQRAVLAANLGKLDEALSFNKQATSRFPDTRQLIRINFHSALCLYPTDRQAAKIYKNSAISLGERHRRTGLFSNGADDLLVRGLIDLGDKHMYGNGSKVARLYRDFRVGGYLLDFSKDRERDRNEVLAGLGFYSDASTIAQRSGIRTGWARVHFASGKLSLSNQSFEEADNEFKKALNLEFPNEEISDRSVALWRTKLGDEDYDRAVLMFKKEFLRRSH